MSIINPFETPQFQELSQLEQKRVDILSRLEDNGLLTPELKAAYSRGLDVIGSQIVQIVSQYGFQDEIINHGRAAKKNLEGLEALGGILPEDELEPLRTDFTQKLTAVRDFLERHSDYLLEDTRAYLEQSLGEVAVVGGLEPIIPEAPALPAEQRIPPTGPIETKGEKNKIELELTVRKGVLQIGKHGKIVPFFSKNLQLGHRDYSQERLATLRVLVENQDRSLKSGELKEASGNPNMSSNEFTSVRSWLLSLTYRRQPLIEKTGSSKGSSYGIAPQFNLNLVDAEVSKTEKEKALLDKGDIWVAVRQLETYRPGIVSLLVQELMFFRNITSVS